MRLRVLQGDITTQSVDAIVNAANSSLLGGGGVDGAIHAAAGPELLEHCMALRATDLPHGLPAGQAVATPAGNLPAQWVIHTVGPKYWEHPDGGIELLRDAHLNALHIAADLGARSVAFPAISCGVYGWSAKDAAPIAIRALRDFSSKRSDHGIAVVQFVCFNDEAFTHFQAQATPRST